MLEPNKGNLESEEANKGIAVQKVIYSMAI